MIRILRASFCFLLILVSVASFAFATDMSKGLDCPPGWNDNISARGNDVIKQCISPNQNAFIELYAAPGPELPLGKLLDLWTAQMTQRGLPFQDFISEQPGHVSGYPAVTRVYSGHTKNGAYFDSSLVASRYKGVNYIFQGLSMKGHERARQNVRHSMNTWYYPGVEDVAQPAPSPGSFGSSGSGGSPYDNYHPQQTPVPSSIRVERLGNGCDALLRITDNFGNPVLDFQSQYVGSKPFNNEKLPTGWRSLRYHMFYRTTIRNTSDATIHFVKVIVDSFKKMTQYCTKSNGQKYACGQSMRTIKNLSGNNKTLLVDGADTNDLLPGKLSVKQGYYNTNTNDFSGKTSTYTYFFNYRGRQFSFKSCRLYR